MTGKMLSKANVLGVKMADINAFLMSHANLRKVRDNKGNKCQNDKEYVKNNLIGSSLMSLKVDDQRMVTARAMADQAAARTWLWEASSTGKHYLNVIDSLNTLLKYCRGTRVKK